MRYGMGGHRDPMRRHFCITIWQLRDGDLEIENGYRNYAFERELIIETARMCKAHYIAWSLEDAALENEDETQPAEVKGIHFHAYIECRRSIRWSTVRNRFQQQFKGAHVEVRRGWRASAREYHMGLRHGTEKPSLITAGEWGGWREDDAGEGPDDIAQEAADMIVHGASPRDVAERFPRWFIRNGFGIIRLWETLNGRKWGAGQ